MFLPRLREGSHVLPESLLRQTSASPSHFHSKDAMMRRLGWPKLEEQYSPTSPKQLFLFTEYPYSTAM